MKYKISELMEKTGVKFGTSGARGMETEMTDLVCYSYTLGFLQYLQSMGELKAGSNVGIAGDFRPSTERIMTAVSRAAADMGLNAVNCGRVPTPAVALYGLDNTAPVIMVTGSHIPSDRNGIKFYKCEGEVLKSDEPGITSQVVDLSEDMFTDTGTFSVAEYALPEEDSIGAERYVARYLDVFPSDCLAGKKIGIYQHSAVGRDLIVDIFKGLGADVTVLGRSEVFIPVDTEAIRDEDVALARQWAKEYGFDALISTDGDSDRPLISDENGEWLRGDVLGILVSQYLKADSVSVPVSCNTALEKSELFGEVCRTRIGSPFVIESMNKATAAGRSTVVGYEANGGFLTNSAVSVFGNELSALPTRDAVLPILSTLLLSVQENKSVAELLAAIPERYTLSGIIREFPSEESKKILELFADDENIKKELGSFLGTVESVDTTDGIRITFESQEVVHLRPSGNAPEFRCYNEADSQERVQKLQNDTMEVLMKLKAN